MLESMTGYGRGSAKGRDGSAVVEIKSVNSKYLELRARLPKEYADLESKISSYVKSTFKRGSIDFFLNIEERSQANKGALIDMKKAKRFYDQSKSLQKKLRLKGEIDINTFLRNRDLFNVNEAPPVKISQRVIKEALAKAVRKLKSMRSKEGRHLETDIKKRLDKFRAVLKKVEMSKLQLRSRMIGRLKRRVKDIKKDIKFDSARLEQEIVFYAAKSDITEEVIRLKSHIKKFADSMSAKGPCGRNLDFIIQEMNREINTIGSKSQDSDIASCVVELKTGIEKIREQVQNIE